MTCHVFTGLYQGVTIAICEGLRYIQQNMKETQATVMVAVPAIFEVMHRKVWKQAEATGAAGKLQLSFFSLPLHDEKDHSMFLR